MAKEYIEREAALSFPFANGLYDHENANMHFIYGCESYKEWLEQLPAADVVPVRHGRWITAKHPLYSCSECGAVFQEVGYGFDYCPNCGADMKDGDGE